MKDQPDANFQRRRCTHQTDIEAVKPDCHVVYNASLIFIARQAGLLPLMSRLDTLMVDGPSISSKSRSSAMNSLLSVSTLLPPNTTTKRFWVHAAQAPLRAAGRVPLKEGSVQARPPYTTCEPWCLQVSAAEECHISLTEGENININSALNCWLCAC